jgi:hypothetical protein
MIMIKHCMNLLPPFNLIYKCLIMAFFNGGFFCQCENTRERYPVRTRKSLIEYTQAMLYTIYPPQAWYRVLYIINCF